MSYPGFQYKSENAPYICDGDRQPTLNDLKRLEIGLEAYEEEQTWDSLVRWTKRMKNSNRKQHKYFIINECVAMDYGTGPNDTYPRGQWHGYCCTALADRDEDLEQLRACAILILENGYKGSFHELLNNAAMLVDSLIDSNPEIPPTVSNDEEEAEDMSSWRNDWKP